MSSYSQALRLTVQIGASPAAAWSIRFSAATSKRPLPLKTIISAQHAMIFSSSEQTVPHSKTGLDVETRRLLVFHVYDKVLRKGFKSPNTQYRDLHTEAGNAARCVLLLASAVLQDEVHAETCGGPRTVFATQNLYQTTTQRAPPTGPFHCHSF